MRLIDADAIEWKSPAVGIVHKSGIDAMPTVEAIPIEWLNRIASEWKTRKIPMGDPDDGEYIIFQTWKLTKRIIDEWREERGCSSE
jgi:hypothetical protein